MYGGRRPGPERQPQAQRRGAIIHLNAKHDLAGPLGRVEAAGGKVLMPKTHISDDIGLRAFFLDTEGNAVGDARAGVHAGAGAGGWGRKSNESGIR